MNHTRTRIAPTTRTRDYDGFAVPLDGDSQLGHAMLIAENIDGATQPVAVTSTINEARELAASDLQIRERSLNRGEKIFCPVLYKLWARGTKGEYRVASEIPV